MPYDFRSEYSRTSDTSRRLRHTRSMPMRVGRPSYCQASVAEPDEYIRRKYVSMPELAVHLQSSSALRSCQQFSGLPFDRLLPSRSFSS